MWGIWLCTGFPVRRVRGRFNVGPHVLLKPRYPGRDHLVRHVPICGCVAVFTRDAPRPDLGLYGSQRADSQCRRFIHINETLHTPGCPFSICSLDVIANDLVIRTPRPNNSLRSGIAMQRIHHRALHSRVIQRNVRCIPSSSVHMFWSRLR